MYRLIWGLMLGAVCNVVFGNEYGGAGVMLTEYEPSLGEVPLITTMEVLAGTEAQKEAPAWPVMCELGDSE